MPSIKQLAARELHAFVASLPDGVQAQLLDVREPWEVQAAALELPGATPLRIPMHELPARLSELDATQPILALCHHGARSLQVVAFLLRAGMSDVYNVAGGIDAWSREVDPLVPQY